MNIIEQAYTEVVKENPAAANISIGTGNAPAVQNKLVEKAVEYNQNIDPTNGVFHHAV